METGRDEKEFFCHKDLKSMFMFIREIKTTTKHLEHRREVLVHPLVLWLSVKQVLIG